MRAFLEVADERGAGLFLAVGGLAVRGLVVGGLVVGGLVVRGLVVRGLAAFWAFWAF